MDGLDAFVLSCLPGLFVAAAIVIFHLGNRSLHSRQLPAIRHLHSGRASEIEGVRYKDPSTFSGNAAEFNEWLISLDESLIVLRPSNPVTYAACFLQGKAGALVNQPVQA